MTNLVIRKKNLVTHNFLKLVGKINFLHLNQTSARIGIDSKFIYALRKYYITVGIRSV